MTERNNIFTKEQNYFSKAIMFLILTSFVMLLNRFFSSLFSQSISSIFSFFGGQLINYTALLFFLPAVSFYNFRKTFSDERFITVMDLISFGIWIFALMLILFPQMSIKYSFIHFPFIELVITSMLLFLFSFSSNQKSEKIFVSISLRILLFLTIPYNFFVLFSIEIQLTILTLYIRPTFFLILISYIATIIVILLINVIRRKIKNTFKFIKNSIFPVIAFTLYFLIINPSNYHLIHRYSLIIFYILIIPVLLKINKNIVYYMDPVINSQEN